MSILNHKFKDGVFCRLFGSAEYRDNLLSLFNALNGTDYENADELIINTIEDVVFMGIKNDSSCILDMQMNLFEEQSTFNPNAPLRGLMYFGRLYEGYLVDNGLNRYGTRLLKIPNPKYYVLYLGKNDRPDKEILKLSDAFAISGSDKGYEWSATVLNVNIGHNEDILDACNVLKEYAWFVDCSRRHLLNSPNDHGSKTKAMLEAVDECITNGILTDFLLKNKAGVVNMYLTEWDEDAYREALRQEAKEDGYAEGHEEGLAKGHAEGLAEGKAEGLAKGKAEGRAEDREEVNRLNLCLINDDRIEDLKRSAIDREFQDKLMAEYGIGSA